VTGRSSGCMQLRSPDYVEDVTWLGASTMTGYGT
jgi:hypothetical protein